MTFPCLSPLHSQFSRRAWLAAVGGGSAALLWHGLEAGGAEPAEPAAKQSSSAELAEMAQLMTAETKEAIAKALSWLAKRQNEDGTFFSPGYGKNTAVVGLGGMAWLASGSSPGRGPFGRHLDRAVANALAAADDSGFISQREFTSHGPMYDHGFATLFLAEVYGMSAEREIREKLQKAVKLIVTTQNGEGGWRYQPKVGDADLSVTICQVMALRAARNAGMSVPNEVIKRCVEYVKRCQNADGGFMYQATGGVSRFPRSAAGIVALNSAGIYSGDEIDRGQAYLLKDLPSKEDFSRDSYAIYGHYYAIQVMWQAGGEAWNKWYPAIQTTLLAQQQADGSWADLICNEYGTAMACIVLQTPNNLLPIFQR